MMTDACNNNEHIPTRVVIIFIHCSPVHNLYKTSHPAVHLSCVNLPCSHMKDETNGRNHHKPPCHQKCLGAHKCNGFQSGYSATWLDTVFSGRASGKGVSLAVWYAAAMHNGPQLKERGDCCCRAATETSNPSESASGPYI